MAIPARSASRGLIAITFSQTTLVRGFGSSCSQARSAWVPSQTVGSGRNSTSIPSETARSRGGRRPRVSATGCGRMRAVRPEAPAQGLGEAGLEGRVVLARVPPARLEEAEPLLSAIPAFAAGEEGQHLRQGPAVVQGGDRRLDQPHGPVEGPDVAPGFQRVGGGQVPIGMGAGLVVVEPGMDLERHPRHPGGEIEGAGGLVDRVGAEHDERLDGAAPHRLRELRQGPGAGLLRGRRVDARSCRYCRAHR